MTAGQAPVFQCRVPGTPAPEGSMRALRRGGLRVVPDNATALRRWRDTVDQHARITLMGDQAWHPLIGPVNVHIVFAFSRPVSHPKTRPTWPTGRGTVGDIDKLARAVLDALTGSVWRDDAQVIGLTAVKDWCGQGPARLLTLPGAIIRVWRVETPPPVSGQIPLTEGQETPT